jgi:hypothetical protein
MPTSTTGNDKGLLVGTEVGQSLGGFAESMHMPSRTKDATALIRV